MVGRASCVRRQATRTPRRGLRGQGHDQLAAMGMEEGLTQAVRQIDAILWTAADEADSQSAVGPGANSRRTVVHHPLGNLTEGEGPLSAGVVRGANRPRLTGGEG
jgi:hypothetical protein